MVKSASDIRSGNLIEAFFLSAFFSENDNPNECTESLPQPQVVYAKVRRISSNCCNYKKKLTFRLLLLGTTSTT